MVLVPLINLVPRAALASGAVSGIGLFSSYNRSLLYLIILSPEVLASGAVPVSVLFVRGNL
jgi:hypothetical protein